MVLLVICILMMASGSDNLDPDIQVKESASDTEVKVKHAEDSPILNIEEERITGKHGQGEGSSLSKGDSHGDKNNKAAYVTQEHADFPNTLQGFRYDFNENGELRDLDTGERFVFNVKEDHRYNQKRYEALGEVLNDHVYELLEREVNLERIYVPVDAEDSEPSSFFFMSENALSNPDKLMIIIHGSGVVRAGQWARRLIINDCLDSGTQLPFIKKAKEEGYAVIVLNTNLNFLYVDGRSVDIRGNDSPEAHALYVWDHFISRASARHIAVLAHSYGGVVTTHLAMKRKAEFLERVFAVAFTDSVHSLSHQRAPHSVIDFYKNNAKNWVSSTETLDTPIPREDCPTVSAGHKKHENTSWSSFKSIYKYLAQKFEAIQGQKEEL